MRGPLVGYSSEARLVGREGLALARFVEAQLISEEGGWSSVEILEMHPSRSSAENLLAATAAAGALPYPVLSVDLGAAAAMAYARQHLLLRETAADLDAGFSPLAGADRPLAMLRLLRQAESLVTFRTASANYLRELGCPVGSVIPMPALRPIERPAARADRAVLVINHLAAPQDARPVVALLRRAVGSAALIGATEAPAVGLDALFSWFSGHACEAVAHVHVGLPGGSTEAPRLVDSFACGRPVLLHLPGGSGGSAPPIAHESDGMVTIDEVGLLAGMLTLLEDSVFSGILTQNAERRMRAFNQDCAAALRDALPRLFGNPREQAR